MHKPIVAPMDADPPMAPRKRMQNVAHTAANEDELEYDPIMPASQFAPPAPTATPAGTISLLAPLTDQERHAVKNAFEAARATGRGPVVQLGSIVLDARDVLRRHRDF